MVQVQLKGAAPGKGAGRARLWARIAAVLALTPAPGLVPVPSGGMPLG